MYIAISLIVIAIVIIFIINRVRKSKEKFTVDNPNEYSVEVFTMPGCGWCKKAGPVVEELNEGGKYDEILMLDVAEPDNAKRGFRPANLRVFLI